MVSDGLGGGGALSKNLFSLTWEVYSYSRVIAECTRVCHSDNYVNNSSNYSRTTGAHGLLRTMDSYL